MSSALLVPVSMFDRWRMRVYQHYYSHSIRNGHSMITSHSITRRQTHSTRSTHRSRHAAHTRACAHTCHDVAIASHRSQSDSFNVWCLFPVSFQMMKQNTQIFAILAYLLADIPHRLPHSLPVGAPAADTPNSSQPETDQSEESQQ